MSVIGSSDLIGRAPGGRKLIAVVYADMVGYSRLIGLDDLGTLERLRTLRTTLIDPAIQVHGGRIIQTAGDSLLIMFDSIDGAVRCAVELQQRVPDYDADQPPDRVVRFRVGINIGDVIADGTNLHGEATNVAARLQAECPPGGICVSRAVCDHVHGRLDLVFEELGPLSLKNIARPVEAYVLRNGPPQPAAKPPASASHQNTHQPKLRQLSVMVAPLRNLGIAKEHEHLVESITDDISTDLPKYLGPLAVVSDDPRRDGSRFSARDIARNRGMTYVIQGSVRGTADRVALNLQLTDVETGFHLWTERFDFIPDGTLDPRNDVTPRVTATLYEKLLNDVSSRNEALPPEDWTHDDLVVRGLALSLRPLAAQLSPDLNRREALSCFERALAMAPQSLAARIGVASVLLLNGAMGESPLAGPHEKRIERLLADVLGSDGHIASAHMLMGILRRLQFRLDDSLIALKVATGLAPNHYPSTANLGMTLTSLGQPDAAMPLIERSLKISPDNFWPPLFHSQLGLCHLLLGDAAEAVISLKTARAMNPGMYFVHWWLAAAQGLNGNLEEARAALAHAIEMKPDLHSRPAVTLRRTSPRFVALYEKTVYVGLRRAGLPDIWAGTNNRPAEWTGA